MASNAVIALIKNKLQELFAPNDQRLIGLIGVSKPGKKKKLNYLVVTLTVRQPQQVHIHRVKTFEATKKGDGYKKVKSWNLSDLKLVDGKSTQLEDSTFSLHFEKSYKWTAMSSGEKDSFIMCLWKMIQRFPNYHNTEFTNVDKDRLKEMTQYSTSNLLAQVGREPSEEVEEYQELLPKEEEDLNEILTSNEKAIIDSERLVEKISEELSQLDEVSIKSIIESEDQVHTLIYKLEEAYTEVCLIEGNLQVYETLLSDVRDTIQKTCLQFQHVLVEDKNMFNLKETLTDLVMKLDLDKGVERMLTSAPLTEYNVDHVCKAALRLKEVVTEEVGPLNMVSAVVEQKKKFSILVTTFSQRLQNHLEDILSEFCEKAYERVSHRSAHQVQSPNLPDLATHKELYSSLNPFSPLVIWLKEMQSARYDEICKKYRAMLGKVYDVEIKDFLSICNAWLRQRISATKKPGSKMDESMYSLPATSTSYLAKSIGLLSKSASSLSLTSAGIEEIANSGLFFQVFVHVLNKLEPLCTSEQQFCCDFFGFTAPTDKTLENVMVIEDEDDSVDGNVFSKKNLPMVDLSQVMEEGLKGMLTNVFQVLVPQMELLMQSGDKLDSFNTLHMLVYISRRWKDMVERRVYPSFLDNTLTNTLVCVKGLFEKFLKTKVQEVLESKPSKKKAKCGILPCVLFFARFADRSEGIMEEGDRRVEVDRAYRTLMDAVIRTIERCATDHHRTPSDVVRFENYHHLFDVLSRLKIPGMEGYREEAKRNYKKYIEQYCRHSLGRPLEKLSLFFEGVEQLIHSNTRPEEVGYRVDFNRAALKENLQKYPGKEVRKGVEKLYKKVEKDVSEEEGLLTVVWGYTQEAFIRQVSHFDMLMKKCYPGTNITLLFTVADLQEYFSSVAREQEHTA